MKFSVMKNFCLVSLIFLVASCDMKKVDFISFYKNKYLPTMEKINLYNTNVSINSSGDYYRIDIVDLEFFKTLSSREEPDHLNWKSTSKDMSFSYNYSEVYDQPIESVKKLDKTESYDLSFYESSSRYYKTEKNEYFLPNNQEYDAVFTRTVRLSTSNSTTKYNEDYNYSNYIYSSNVVQIESYFYYFENTYLGKEDITKVIISNEKIEDIYSSDSEKNEYVENKNNTTETFYYEHDLYTYADSTSFFEVYISNRKENIERNIIRNISDNEEISNVYTENVDSYNIYESNKTTFTVLEHFNCATYEWDSERHGFKIIEEKDIPDKEITINLEDEQARFDKRLLDTSFKVTYMENALATSGIVNKMQSYLDLIYLTDEQMNDSNSVFTWDFNYYKYSNEKLGLVYRFDKNDNCINNIEIGDKNIRYYFS